MPTIGPPSDGCQHRPDRGYLSTRVIGNASCLQGRSRSSAIFRKHEVRASRTSNGAPKSRTPTSAFKSGSVLIHRSRKASHYSYMTPQIRRSPTPIRTVVIVGDDLGFVGMLRERIKEAGCRPIWAPDAREALAAITHEKPAIVVIDIGAPSVRGRELLAKLERSPALARIPRVLLSIPTKTSRHDGPDSAQCRRTNARRLGNETGLSKRSRPGN